MEHETQEERAARLRAEREALTASGGEQDEALDQDIAEADGQSLTGSGAPRH